MYGFRDSDFLWTAIVIAVVGWGAIEGVLWIVRNLPFSVVWG